MRRACGLGAAGWVAWAMAVLVGWAANAHAETLLAPWGNVAGMRVGGEPIEFEAGLRLVHEEWAGFSSAVKYLQRPRYTRSGGAAEVVSAVEGVGFRQAVRDTGPGEATFELEIRASTNQALAGAFLCFELPDSTFSDGRLEVWERGVAGEAGVKVAGGGVQGARELLGCDAVGWRVASARNTLDVRWDKPLRVRVRRESSDRPTGLNDPAIRQKLVAVRQDESVSPGRQVYVELVGGSLLAGQSASLRVTVKAEVVPDRARVRCVLDPSSPGRPFDGVGGNFRMQFPETDAAVLAYNLEHLRSAWGRFDLYWAEWDPEEREDPLAAARAGRIHPKIAGALEVGRSLARRGMRLIVSAWVPPVWARAPGPQPAGLRGTALDGGKLERVCGSLTSYLVFLKEQAGLDVAYFSFNEPETGVEVRQTPAEHVQFLKVMGRHLEGAGLGTRLLLGDTAHGTLAALEFIRPALEDPAVRPHIGAVAFHTWRGCTARSMAGWSAAAGRLGVPLLVTEAGPDAHLHEYPSVRLEPWFQLQEIELYLRVCALAQPATIMEWQWTTDYSVLAGGGVYGEAGPLRPTQRFWNLKQLGITPPGAHALSVTSDQGVVTAAAFGDPAKGRYIIHMVNRGAERPAVLSGLPATVTSLRLIRTDAGQGMQEGGRLAVRDGSVEWDLAGASYTSLLNY